MKELRQTCIYLTRKCPYRCNYCNLCNSGLTKPDMPAEQWIEALRILKKNRVTFNLFLGNETWLYGLDLMTILNSHPMPYAMYSSCNPNVFRKLYQQLFSAGLDSLSCGVDSYQALWKEGQADFERKSYYAREAFTATRSEFPHVDCQATCTIGPYNAHEVVSLVDYFSNVLTMNIGLNYIHSNTDGGFDFFPLTKDMADMGILLTDKYRFGIVQRMVDELFIRHIRHKDHRVQNMEDFIDMPLIFGKTGVTNDVWHCGGNPYGGPTIDADGSLRLCGYRKGTTVCEMTVFDLDKKGGWNEWQRRVVSDAKACPGCLWSYPRLFKYWRQRDPDFGHKVFNSHALAHVKPENWSNRKITEVD